MEQYSPQQHPAHSGMQQNADHTRSLGIGLSACRTIIQAHGGTIQAAKELGLDHHATIKTLILEDEGKKPFVCLMHGDCEISTKNLARARGCKTVAMCDPATADRHSGYHVGGTSPFGTRKRMTVYVQKTIYDLPDIYINAGHRGILVAMKSADLDKALPGLTVPVDVSLD